MAQTVTVLVCVGERRPVTIPLPSVIDRLRAAVCEEFSDILPPHGPEGELLFQIQDEEWHGLFC